MTSIETGREAEALAERLLCSAGLAILARNVRCRHGEIDLVAREGDTLVFCEVRLRSGAAYGGAGESISAGKQRRIIAAARFYLAGKPETPCRFDVLLLDGLGAARIRWIRNAFSA